MEGALRRELFPKPTDLMIKQRRAFVKTLEDPKFLEDVTADADTFNDTLRYAEAQRWVHYTRLAYEVYTSPSQVNRWFLPRDAKNASCPRPPLRRQAVEALSRIMNKDIARLEAKSPPVGGTPLETV